MLIWMDILFLERYNALIYEILMKFHSLKFMYKEYLWSANIYTLDVRTSFCLKFSVFRSMHKSHTSHLSHYETRKLLEIQNIVRPSINSFRKTFLYAIQHICIIWCYYILINKVWQISFQGSSFPSSLTNLDEGNLVFWGRNTK